MKFWKIYFWLYALILTAGIISTILSKNPVDSAGLLLVGGITLWALYGLIEGKAYLHIIVWKILFIFQMISIVLMTIGFLAPTLAFGFGYLFVILPYILINIIVIGPAIYGTYWYAYKYKSIWQ